MKKFGKVLFFTILIFSCIAKIEALSVDTNDVTIKEGESSNIELYANVGEAEVTSIEFNLVYTTYDIPANFIVTSMYSDSITNTRHKISFDTPVTGNVNIGNVKVSVVNNPKDKIGTINITNAKAYTEEGEEKELNTQIITVNVDESDEELVNTDIGNNTTSTTDDDKNENNVDIEEHLLKSIDSDIVNIVLKDNVFEYTVKINENIEELDLKPVLTNDSYKVEVSSQKIEELEDGKITITVSKGDVKEVYTINVKIIEDIEIDDSEFEPGYSYKGKWITIIAILSIVLLVGIFFTMKKK